jgi:hypothetical protein
VLHHADSNMDMMELLIITSSGHIRTDAAKITDAEIG